jgi:single-stranded DNA-specific DHH superfamily exonuclease
MRQRRQVVVTDHHDLGEIRFRTLMPSSIPSFYQQIIRTHLAGVGVAYKLAKPLVDDHPAELAGSSLVALG